MSSNGSEILSPIPTLCYPVTEFPDLPDSIKYASPLPQRLTGGEVRSRSRSGTRSEDELFVNFVRPTPSPSPIPSPALAPTACLTKQQHIKAIYREREMIKKFEDKFRIRTLSIG